MTVQIYNKNRNLCKIINFSPRCLPKLPFGGRKSAKNLPKLTIFNQNTSQGLDSSFPLPILYIMCIFQMSESSTQEMHQKVPNKLRKAPNKMMIPLIFLQINESYFNLLGLFFIIV